MAVVWWFVEGRDRIRGRTPVAMPRRQGSAPSAGETPQSRAIARAIDGTLRDGLRRFDLVDLLSARAPGEADPARPADYRLDTSIVRRIDGPVDVTLVLNRVSDQRAIWSTQTRVAREHIPGFSREGGRSRKKS